MARPRHTTTPPAAPRRVAREGPGRARRPRLARARRARASSSPSRSFNFDFPSGTVEGDTFLGIEGNGWTWVVFAAAGLLLLLGSPIHWGAKSMAFIVGVAMRRRRADRALRRRRHPRHRRHQQLDEADHGRRAAPALILLSMMPRVGRRRGGAPVATRRDRELDEPAAASRDRDLDEPATAIASDRGPRAGRDRRAHDQHPARSTTAARARRSRARPRRGRLRAEARQTPRRTGLRPRGGVGAGRVRDDDVLARADGGDHLGQRLGTLLVDREDAVVRAARARAGRA